MAIDPRDIKVGMVIEYNGDGWSDEYRGTKVLIDRINRHEISGKIIYSTMKSDIFAVGRRDSNYFSTLVKGFRIINKPKERIIPWL